MLNRSLHRRVVMTCLIAEHQEKQEFGAKEVKWVILWQKLCFSPTKWKIKKTTIFIACVLKREKEHQNDSDNKMTKFKLLDENGLQLHSLVCYHSSFNHSWNKLHRTPESKRNFIHLYLAYALLTGWEKHFPAYRKLCRKIIRLARLSQLVICSIFMANWLYVCKRDISDLKASFLVYGPSPI